MREKLQEDGNKNVWRKKVAKKSCFGVEPAFDNNFYCLAGYTNDQKGYNRIWVGCIYHSIYNSRRTGFDGLVCI